MKKEKLPHKVWRSKLAQLAWLINKAIDNGNYDLPIEEVRKAADQERIVQYLKEHLPTHTLLDFSLFKPEDVAAINHWFQGLNGNYDIYIERQGLCLALAWTIEMMQNAGSVEDVMAEERGGN